RLLAPVQAKDAVRGEVDVTHPGQGAGRGSLLDVGLAGPGAEQQVLCRGLQQLADRAHLLAAKEQAVEGPTRGSALTHLDGAKPRLAGGGKQHLPLEAIIATFV